MIELLIVLPLIFIIYEDFKYRAIHWVWLIIFTFLILFFKPLIVPNILINLLLLGIQLICLTLYFSIKKNQLVNITKEFLGIGDILFFIPLTLLFTPENFIWFFICSLTFTLLFVALQKVIFNSHKNTIPLAAWMSIALIIVFAISSYYNFNLNFDSLVINSLI